MIIRTAKQCSRCKETKSIDNFYKASAEADGHQYWCKACVKQRAQTPHGKAVIKRAQEKFSHSNKYKEIVKRYLQSSKGRCYHCAKMKRYRERYPEREDARQAVRKAIREGILPSPKTLPCTLQYLGTCSDRIEYHHPNGFAHEHWLDVQAICRKHHLSLPQQ